MDDRDPAFNRLYWESSFEIVQALMQAHRDVDLDSVGTGQLFQWITALPNFADDPAMANESILTDILREWYEEVHF